MDLKHVKNIQGNTASMFLFSEIGGWGIDGQMFADELQWLGKNGVDDVTIHINSGGGSVLDGLSILRAIQMFGGSITTQIEGIAASIAGVIALGGQKRTMVDFGRIMVHDPSFTNVDELDDKQKNALNAIREMLIDIFDKNTNIERDEIDTIMKTETWFDSITALSRGMIDEIVPTDRNAQNVFEGQTTIAGMVNRANSIHQQNSQTIEIKMESVKNHLKLDKNSNETAIVDAITAIENRVESAETKVTELTNTIETKDQEIADATQTIVDKQIEIDGLVKTIAANTVDQAISVGKFGKEKRDELIDQAVEMGVEKFNNMIQAIKSVPAKITDQLKGGDGSDQTEGKTFRQLEKENPTVLNALKKDNPTKYAELFQNEYGVEYAAN